MISTLQKKPQLRENVKNLIESSFAYGPDQDLFKDFAPLFQSESSPNLYNYVLIDPNTGELAGHIGAWKRHLELEGKIFPICLLGGIAIDKSFRGQGHFRPFMEHVLNAHLEHTTLFLLWSDLSDMYQKLGFHEVGHQYHFNPNAPPTDLPSPFRKVSWEGLDDEHLKTLDTIHKRFTANHSKAAFLKRDVASWRLFREITSSKLFLYRENGEILGYAVRDKGMDLAGIYHDYACLPQVEDDFFSILKKHNFWVPANLIVDANVSSTTELYLGLIKTGNPELFGQFLECWGKPVPTTQNWDTSFLRSLFGPCSGNEFYRPFYVGGLESI